MITRDQLKNFNRNNIDAVVDLFIKDLPGSDKNEKLQKYIHDMFAYYKPEQDKDAINPYLILVNGKEEEGILFNIMKALQIVYPEEAKLLTDIVKDNNGYDPGILVMIAMTIRAFSNIYSNQ